MSLKQLEPYTSQSNAEERKIKELKIEARHKLLKTKAPKCLWDDCLELEAYLRFNTVHDIYKVDGEIP